MTSLPWQTGLQDRQCHALCTLGKTSKCGLLTQFHDWSISLAYCLEPSFYPMGLFFNDFTIFTQNAEHVSKPFFKTCGVNQGCPISPLLYDVIGELIAHRIKGNPKIRGVKMSNGQKEVEHVIT